MSAGPNTIINSMDINYNLLVVIKIARQMALSAPIFCPFVPLSASVGFYLCNYSAS